MMTVLPPFSSGERTTEPSGQTVASVTFPGVLAGSALTGSGAARSVKPDAYDFVFVPSCYAEQIDVGGSELFVNTASLGEMRNETIRYWMDFIQRRTAVKHLFTQNRFLNTIDPFQHAWRWEENEASVHYDASWAVLKWDLRSEEHT